MTVYNPRICRANLVTEDMITVSSGSTSKIRLIDRNSDRRWVAIGEGEAGTITIALTSEFDTIIIQNTNMSEFTVQYDSGTDFSPVVSNTNASGGTINIVDSDNNYLIDGSADYIVSGATATQVYNSYYFKVTKVTPATSVVITVTGTTNEEALRVGQIILTKEVLQIDSAGSLKIQARVKQELKELSDGSINKIFIRNLFDYDMDIYNATDQARTQLLLLQDINKRESFVFIPRPAMYTDVFDGHASHVNWTNPFELNNYFGNLQINGWVGNLKFSQASGIR